MKINYLFFLIFFSLQSMDHDALHLVKKKFDPHRVEEIIAYFKFRNFQMENRQKDKKQEIKFMPFQDEEFIEWSEDMKKFIPSNNK